MIIKKKKEKETSILILSMQAMVTIVNDSPLEFRPSRQTK